MIKPLGNRVLVERVEAETKTAGGLFLPDTAKEKPQEAIVRAIGTGGRDKDARGILIELSLVLAGSFRLLLTLQAGADIMLALLNFGNNALLGAATLKATQSAFQRFVLLYANFRHGFPSLRWHPARSWMRSGPNTRLEYYILLFSNCQAGFR